MQTIDRNSLHFDKLLALPDRFLHMGVTGTQGRLTAVQWRFVSEWLDKHRYDFDVMHNGMCIGFDTLAASEAPRRWLIVGHPCDIPSKRGNFFPDIQLDPLPPLDRNSNIVAWSSLMLACPSTDNEALRSGTWATIRRARAAKLPLIIVFPSGSVQEENL